MVLLAAAVSLIPALPQRGPKAAATTPGHLVHTISPGFRRPTPQLARLQQCGPRQASLGQRHSARQVRGDRLPVCRMPEKHLLLRLVAKHPGGELELEFKM